MWQNIADDFFEWSIEICLTKEKHDTIKAICTWRQVQVNQSSLLSFGHMIQHFWAWIPSFYEIFLWVFVSITCSQLFGHGVFPWQCYSSTFKEDVLQSFHWICVDKRILCVRKQNKTKHFSN